MTLRAVRRQVGLVCAIAATGSSALNAQAGPDSTRVIGRLVGEGGATVGRGTVQVRGRPGLVLTGGTGAFELLGLPRGHYLLIGRALGYDSATAEVTVGSGATPSVTITLPLLPQELPEVTVEEEKRRTTAHVAGFERRRATGGQGFYLTREDIDRERQQNLQALLLRIPGVRLDCRTRQCVLTLGSRNGAPCQPQYYLDGVPTDPLMVSSSLYHVYGVEVYRRQVEVPQEFRPHEAPCGVVAVWTRGKW